MLCWCNYDVAILFLRSDGGGVDKSRLKLTSAKVEVELGSRYKSNCSSKVSHNGHKNVHIFGNINVHLDSI